MRPFIDDGRILESGRPWPDQERNLTALHPLFPPVLAWEHPRPGFAGAAFVVLAATLSTTGVIPVASIALILGIHRILAEGLTFVNLVGNCLATIVVAKWEGAIDERRLAETIGTNAHRRLHLADAA
jgi:hypothetical protein